MAEFTGYLAEVGNRIDATLGEICSELPRNSLIPPIQHTLDGGKRFRGFLVVESAKINDITGKIPEYVAAAIECLHAYSLVHDDLPCMDDDPLRRGKPTIHTKWNEMMAVLVGDALQTLAFEILSDRNRIPDPDIRADLVYSLARASGVSGMVFGQILDMEAESNPHAATVEDITILQQNKTGKLIGFSCEAGAILSRTDPTNLLGYAASLGLAFQIADDLLDITGNVEDVGKTLDKDSSQGKHTFVSLLGEEEARNLARDQVEEAVSYLEPYGNKAKMLVEAARFAITRTK